MNIKGKYKKLFISSIALLVIINIAAIIFVFSNYRKSLNIVKEVSNTKMKYSEVKDSIKKTEENIKYVSDTCLKEDYITMENEKSYLDSVLNLDRFTIETIDKINEKIDEVAALNTTLSKSVTLNMDTATTAY